MKKIDFEKIFIYQIFCFSTFSIAGIDASIILLYFKKLISSIKSKRVRLPKDAFSKALAVFVLIVFLTSLLSNYSPNLFMAIRAHWRYLLPVMLAIFFLERDEKEIFKFFFLFLFLVSSWGVVQFFFGVNFIHKFLDLNFSLNVGERATGSFSHALTYGGVMLIFIPTIIGLFFSEKKPKEKLILFVLFLMVFMAVIASQSRSVWLGMIASLFVVWILLKPKAGLIGALLCVVLITVFVENFEYHAGVGSVYDKLGSRFVSSFSVEDSSSRERIYMWRAGWDAIQDHFWFGIGFNQDEVVMKDYWKKYEESGYVFHNRPGIGLHNLYLQTWLDYGIIGLISFLFIWISFFYESLKTLQLVDRFSQDGIILIGGVAGVVGHLVEAFFENNFRDGEVQTAVLLLIGLSLSKVYKYRYKEVPSSV